MNLGAVNVAWMGKWLQQWVVLIKAELLRQSLYADPGV